MPMTPREMVQLLEANGFVEIRRNGSHRFFENRELGRRTTVPYHSKDLPKGTERIIKKQAGLL